MKRLIRFIPVFFAFLPTLLVAQIPARIDTAVLSQPEKRIKHLLKSDFIATHHIHSYVVITDDRKITARGLRLFKLDGSRVDVYFRKELSYRKSFSNPCLLHRKIQRQRIARIYLIQEVKE